MPREVTRIQPLGSVLFAVHYSLRFFFEVSAECGERRIRVIVSRDESLFTSHGGGCAE